jgi:hypothetical protein
MWNYKFLFQMKSGVLVKFSSEIVCLVILCVTTAPVFRYSGIQVVAKFNMFRPLFREIYSKKEYDRGCVYSYILIQITTRDTGTCP